VGGGGGGGGGGREQKEAGRGGGCGGGGERGGGESRGGGGGGGGVGGWGGVGVSLVENGVRRRFFLDYRLEHRKKKKREIKIQSLNSSRQKKKGLNLEKKEPTIRTLRTSKIAGER